MKKRFIKWFVGKAKILIAKHPKKAYPIAYCVVAVIFLANLIAWILGIIPNAIKKLLSSGIKGKVCAAIIVFAIIVGAIFLLKPSSSGRQNVDIANDPVEPGPAVSADEPVIEPEVVVDDFHGYEAKDWERYEVDLYGLSDNYPDVIGWIWFEDGTVSYPIMYGADNETYIKMDYRGVENQIGSIFLDYRCSKDFTDEYSIIYGRNTGDGAMFSSLKGYKNNADYLKDHQYFQIITSQGKYRYQVFSYIDITDSNTYDSMVGADTGSKADFYNQLVSDSLIHSDVQVKAGDRVITLSTCKSVDSENYIVSGVLVDENLLELGN